MIRPREKSSYYGEISARLERLDSRCSVEIFGGVETHEANYPLYRARIGEPSNPAVLLSAGLHGDEPGGVFALFKFMEEGAIRFIEDYCFHVYPCLNPAGFERRSRYNAEGINLNREFKEHGTAPLEVRAIQEALHSGPPRYVFAQDLHEISPGDEVDGVYYGPLPKAFFMWENCPDKSLRVGTKILSALEQANVPLCTEREIIGEPNNGGVIWYPEGLRNEMYQAATTFESYVQSNYCRHVITSETPTAWALELRVRAHLTVLEVALEEKRKALG